MSDIVCTRYFSTPRGLRSKRYTYNNKNNFGSLFHVVSSKQSINHCNKNLAFDFQISMPHIFEFATFILH